VWRRHPARELLLSKQSTAFTARTSLSYNLSRALRPRANRSETCLKANFLRRYAKIAWHALEAGLDGPGIRRLAALEHPTFFEVAEILPRASQEMGLSELAIGDAALRLASRCAKEILDSGEDPLRHVRDFERLWIHADYPCELQSVGNLDDEVWVAQSCGQSEDKIREWVTARIKALAGRVP